MKHIDLFTGLGGFTLAAHLTGIDTVVMCEADEYRRTGLKSAWPGIPIIEDVREFDGTKWTGAFILTGGVPCQPASRAGQQRGKEDDRWLWPEALRIVAEAKPRWCLFENPPGILDVGLDGILADLEAIGYEAGISDIPACAVNSPQLRHRLWIVAHANETGPENRQCVRQDVSGGLRERETTDHLPALKVASCGDMADTSTQRQRSQSEPKRQTEQGRSEVVNGMQGHMADAGQAYGQRGQDDYWKSSRETPDLPQFGNLWSTYLWTPCADGKVRRTHDDAFDLD